MEISGLKNSPDSVLKLKKKVGNINILLPIQYSWLPAKELVPQPARVQSLLGLLVSSAGEC